MGAKVKGTAVSATLQFIREQFGGEGLERVLARLDPADGERASAVVLSSAWYPLSFLMKVMRAARAEFGGSMPDIIGQMGRASADYAHTTAYKLVFKVGSTQWIISRASLIFSNYYDSGKMVVTESGKGFANIELQGFSEPAPEFCERISGWIVRTFELSGAKNILLKHVTCTCKGAAVCRFEGTWE